MTITIDGGAGITFPDTVQQTNGMTMTGGNPKYYAARAWVSFIPTSSMSIRAAVNVSSVTDLGTGLFRVNFTTAMPDANYAVAGICAGNGSAATDLATLFVPDLSTVLSGSIRFRVSTEAGSAVDVDYVSVAIFR